MRYDPYTFSFRENGSPSSDVKHFSSVLFVTAIKSYAGVLSGAQQVSTVESHRPGTAMWS